MPDLSDPVHPIGLDLRTQPVSMKMAGSLQAGTPDLGDWQSDLPVEILAVRAKGLPWQMLTPGILLGVGMLGFLLYLLRETKVMPPQASGNLAQGKVEAVERRVSPQVVPSNERVQAVFQDLSKVGSVTELVGMVRGGDSQLAKLREYYGDEKVEFLPFSGELAVSPILGRDGFFIVNGVLSNGEFKAAVLTRGAGGGLLLDWDSYVGYGELQWNELLTQQPKEPVLVRAVRTKIEYYNAGFDSDQWQSFELEYPGEEVRLVGYAKRGSALVHQLLPIGNRYGSMDVTLKIHYPEEVEDPRLVIIDSMLSADWVVDTQE
ncbi:hypothetical protein ACFSW8_05460 [Rubritalea tangerina]|uniref:Uncharacterized protein n=1 Tax=Rubritalea tangerina TaxID=430798 RepID=A0ABW4Z8M5_9BACT